MMTEILTDVFDGAAISRQPELLGDDGRDHADVNTPLEHPTLTGRAIGNSSGWREVLKAARRVAATDTTVCLSGESGTGKEVVARFIHAVSPRRHRPFVAINCAALPEQLLESELLGFERGAFTDARQAKPGQIELAAGGVLFLDEISEMTPTAQAKFLRVLQEREFLRLGGTRPIKADIRVIVATNRDLPDAVAKGRLRADLYYRVNVFDIRIPPLRERRDDIIVLAESFLREFGQAIGRRVMGLTAPARERLLAYDWPGNVRELRNVLERATIVCEDGQIRADDLSLTIPPGRAEEDSTDLSALERRTIQRVMHDTAGNKAMAAQQLGISRTQLYGRLRKHGLTV
jgi:transcriptional regulator with PAS, ATPase and Fis domain